MMTRLPEDTESINLAILIDNRSRYGWPDLLWIHIALQLCLFLKKRHDRGINYSSLDAKNFKVNLARDEMIQLVDDSFLLACPCTENMEVRSLGKILKDILGLLYTTSLLKLIEKEHCIDFLSGQIHFQFESKDEFLKPLLRLLRHMLTSDEKKRPSLSKVIEILKKFQDAYLARNKNSNELEKMKNILSAAKAEALKNVPDPLKGAPSEEKLLFSPTLFNNNIPIRRKNQSALSIATTKTAGTETTTSTLPHSTSQESLASSAMSSLSSPPKKNPRVLHVCSDRKKILAVKQILANSPTLLSSALQTETNRLPHK